MAAIRRKPVPPAFYANDSPQVSTLSPPQFQSPRYPRVSISQQSRSAGSDDSAGFHLQGDELPLDDGHARLLDTFNVIERGGIMLIKSDVVASARQLVANGDFAEDISILPAVDYDSESLTQPANPGQQIANPDSIATRRIWTPFWLRKGTLTAFVVLYVLLLMSIVLLWRISRDHDGFTPHISTNRYTWTYGPTAVLTVFVSLWRQTEYHCKVLAPWHEMKQGANASRSLLLDYVSPIQFTSLWLAFRHRTTSVIAAIIGFVCLKLVVIFSTGLLVLSPVVVTNSTYSIQITGAFNGSQYNASVNSIFTPNGHNAPSSSGPVYAYYGHLANNLTLPVGAKDYFAYTAFETKGVLPPQSRLSTEVDVLLPQFECETAKVTADPLRQVSGSTEWSFDVTFEAPSCTLQFSHTLSSDAPSRKRSTGPPDQIFGLCSEVDCSFDPSTEGVNATAVHGPPDYGFVVEVTKIRSPQTSASPVEPEKGNGTVANVTDGPPSIEAINGVICKAAYSMTKANLTYDTSEQDESNRFSTTRPVEKSGKVVVLDQFSFDDLSEAVGRALINSNAIVGISPTSVLNLQPEAPDILSKLMLLAERESSLQIFLADSEAMKRAAAKALNGIAAQYAQQILLDPALKPSTGHIIYSEEKLKVQTTSMGLIGSCLVLLICLSMVVLFSRPQAVVPWKPDSLAAMAVILANSQDLQHLLTDLGRSSTSKIRHRLSAFRFLTVWDTDRANFRIKPSKIEPSAEVRQEMSESHHWHRPTTIRKGFIVTILSLPLVVIGILEGLQQASNRSNGFLNVNQDASDESNYTAILIRYMPASFMLLIATFFNMLDFTVTTFAPFSALRDGNSPTRKSLLSCLVGELPPVALYQAAMARLWGPLYSNLASLTGSMLVIIVSGLLIVENVTVASTVAVQQLDSFTIDAYDHYDGKATATLRLIEQFNLSSPVFTYEDLVFPKIKLSEEATGLGKILSKGDNVSLSVRLPALRAALNCKPVPQKGIEFAFNHDPFVFDRIPDVQYNSQLVLDTNFDLPQGCGGESYHWAENFPLDDYVPDSDKGWSFAGAIGDLTGVTIQSPDCPSLAFYFGSFKMNVTSYENVTVMSCSEHIQEVQALFTVSLPSFEIDSAHPPVVDENAVRFLENATSGFTALQYNVSDMFEQKVVAPYSTVGENGQKAILDSFFRALTSGSEVIRPSQLLSPANADTLLNSVTRLYRKYMAQVINADMRTAPLYPNPAYNATIALPTARLKMNNGSKLTLQILLAIMFVCGTLAYVLTDMRHTLPHNPHTLAGSMTLMAGSEMCSRSVVPEGTEWISDMKLKRVGVFEGYLFSLGWWENGDGGGALKKRRRFGIDIGRAEKAL